jgi:hypothetical protein
MPILVRCTAPRCGRTLRAPDELAGKSAQCPGCGTILTVAAEESDAPIASPAPESRPPVAAADSPGGPIGWIVCAALFAVSLVASFAAGLCQSSAWFEVEFDPRVVETRREFNLHRDDAMRAHRDPTNEPAFKDLVAAANDARDRMWPSIAVRERLFMGTATVAAILAVVEIVAFGFMLRKRDAAGSFRWYAWSIGMIFGGTAICLLAFAIGNFTPYHVWRSPDGRPMSEEIPLSMSLMVGLALALRAFYGSILCYSILLYRLWQCVQDGHAVTTPGKAVGFLFIPIFHVHWMFVALPGLADELNRCADARSLDVPRASRRMFLTSCILQCTYWTMCFAMTVMVGVIALAINSVVSLLALRSATRVAVALKAANAAE